MKKFGWKKNFRKLPESIITKINDIATDEVVVACAKNIPIQDILDGRYAHLNIHFDGETLTVPEAVLPAVQNGRYSKFNLWGREVLLKHLPKVRKTYSWEAPNFGNNGYHDVSMDREVYQRIFYWPKEYEIKMEVVAGGNRTDTHAVIKFSVDIILSKRDEDFEKDLFFNLNLLQENTGVSDVFSSSASTAAYIQAIHVNWEILPPGARDEVIGAILRGITDENPHLGAKIAQRYDLLKSLEPHAFIYDTSGLKRYFGAKFGDNLVVFENLEYGNAIYVMFENWEALSQLSRKDLLRGGYNVIRIVHNPGWEKRLTRIINDFRPPILAA